MRVRFPWVRMAGGLLPLTLISSAFSQTDLRADSVFLADRYGNPTTVALGDSFYVGLRFTVTGTPNSTYRFQIESPYGKIQSSRLDYGLNAPGQYWVAWGSVPTLMDRPHIIKVTLDPEKKVKESNRANNTLIFTFTPTPPPTALDFYDPKNLSGRMGIDLSWKSSSSVPQDLTFWLPRPPAGSLSSTGRATNESDFVEMISERFGQPIAVRSFAPQSIASVHEEVNVYSTARAVRSNAALLKLAGSGVDPEVEQWLQPEALVESNHSAIQNLAANALAAVPASASTFEKAEALFRSVLKKCTYEYKLGTLPSAATMAKKKKGDCGAFSSLFIALCRASGIPARATGGFGLGSNNWHVWAEFHVAGAGWVPVDPSFADGAQPKGGDLPFYFGVIPDLNQRMVTFIGFDRAAGGRSLPMLQSPAVFWTGSGVKLNKGTAFCNLSVG